MPSTVYRATTKDEMGEDSGWKESDDSELNVSEERYVSGPQSGSPNIFTEEAPTQAELRLSELRAGLAAERDKAAAVVEKNIRAARLIDELGSDVSSGLVQALEAVAAALGNIDPMLMDDPKVLRKAGKRIKAILRGRL